MAPLSSAQDASEPVADPVDQAVAAGIVLKLNFAFSCFNEGFSEVKFETSDFQKLLKTIDLDTQSFSDSESGEVMRQGAKELASTIGYMFTAEAPFDDPKYLPKLKTHNINPTTPDPKKLAKLVALEVRNYMETCRLPSTLIPPKLPVDTRTIDERADAAVAEIKRIREAAKLGKTAEFVQQQIGKPHSIESFQTSSIAQTWRYDIDDTVYCLVNFNSDSLVIGTGSSGVKDLIGSDD